MARAMDGEIKADAFEVEPARSASGVLTAEMVLSAQKRSLELVVQGVSVDDVLVDLTRVVESAAEGDAFAPAGARERRHQGCPARDPEA